MKNEYDNEHFFEQYAQMARSRYGLSGAGEWHQLKEMFPPPERQQGAGPGLRIWLAL